MQPKPASPMASSRPIRDPWMIVRDPSLDTEAKLRRLRQLELDARQVSVANEEGMDGPDPTPTLDEILAAIAHLQPRRIADAGPTKA